MIWLLVITLILASIYWLCLSPTSQIFGRFPFRAKTAQKLVALSFDDGPNQPFTGHLLDLLEEQRVPATFFVVGGNLERYPDVVKRAAKAGHVIANHSQSHLFRRYLTSLDFGPEIDRGQATIIKTIGQTPALFRPPWLFRTPMLLRRLKRSGLQPVSGTFVNNWEIFQPTAAKIAATARRRTKPGTILIFHDGYNAKGGRRDQTVQAVGLLIEQLRTDGYEFTTVDRLLKVSAYQA